MNEFESSYLSLLERCLYGGDIRESRAGETRALFGETLRIESLRDSKFPILTTRRIYVSPIMGELYCFLNGYSKLQDFIDAGCKYWTANARAWPPNFTRDEPTLGRIYGVQWRQWDGHIDQIDKLITSLKNDPYGRRHVVTCWHPTELPQMCLPPCHIMFQCFVRDDELDMVVYMRSVDLCLGLPSDIVLYATLLILLSNTTDLQPGALTFMLGDTHIYTKHIPVLNEQLRRIPGLLPMWRLISKLNKFYPDNMVLLDYNPQEKLTYELCV